MLQLECPTPQKEPKQDAVTQMLLYQSLTQLGNLFPLEFRFDQYAVHQDLEKYDSDWVQYNTYKPHINRKGLSVTSLDGKLTGIPDLCSLREYEKRTGISYAETDFRKPTRVFYENPTMRKFLDLFRPWLGRSHYLRFGPGGYFPPHRDGAKQDFPDCFRLIVPLLNTNHTNFVMLLEEERIFLETGRVYFMNTLLSHAVFSFGKDVTLFVANIILCAESVRIVKEHLENY